MVFVNYREHASIKKIQKQNKSLNFFRIVFKTYQSIDKKLTSSESSDITITKPDFVQKLHTMEL
jgi:hypothetical protein